MPVSSLNGIPTFAACAVAAKRRNITVVECHLHFSPGVVGIHEVYAVQNYFHDRATPGSFEAYFDGSVVQVNSRALLRGSGGSERIPRQQTQTHDNCGKP